MDELRHIIANTDWKALGQRLAAFALKLGLRAGLGPDFPGGQSPSDIVQEAIARVLMGRRKWKSDKVSFERFMFGVVRGMMSHLVQSKSTRVEALQPDKHQERLEKARSLKMPRSATAEHSDWTDEQKLDWITREVFARDDSAYLLAVLEGIRRGASSRKELVASLRISDQELDNRLRKLKRLAAKRPKAVPAHLAQAKRSTLRKEAQNEAAT